MNVYVITFQHDRNNFVKKAFDTKDKAIDYIKNLKIADLPQEWFGNETPISWKDYEELRDSGRLPEYTATHTFLGQLAVITEDYLIGIDYKDDEGYPNCVFGRRIEYLSDVYDNAHNIFISCLEVPVE